MENDSDARETRSGLITLINDYMRATKPSKRRQLEQKIAGDLTTPARPTPADVIAEAVQKMPEGPYHDAAFTLWIDADLSGANLTERSAKAASLFGQAPETFRRRHGGRPEVVQELADQLMAIAKDHEGHKLPPASDGSIEVATPKPPQDGQRGSPRTILGLVVAVVAGVTAGAWWLAQAGEDEDSSPGTETAASPLLEGEVDVTLHCEAEHGTSWTATPNPGSDTGWFCLGPDSQSPVPANLDTACAAQYGDSAEARNDGSAADWTCVLSSSDEIAGERCPAAAGAYDPSRAEEFATFTGPFRDRYEGAGGEEELGCPLTVMHRWSRGMIQEIGHNSQSTSALLALDSEQVVLLQGQSWSAFNRIKGINGALVGFPKNEPYINEDGIWVADLTAGGALVAQEFDRPHFWLPPIVFQYWISLGSNESCLGFPITDPFGTGSVFRQDFEKGHIIVDPSAGSFSTESNECS